MQSADGLSWNWYTNGTATSYLEQSQLAYPTGDARLEARALGPGEGLCLRLRGDARGLYRRAGSRDIQARGSTGSDSAPVQLALVARRAPHVSRFALAVGSICYTEYTQVHFNLVLSLSLSL